MLISENVKKIIHGNGKSDIEIKKNLIIFIYRRDSKRSSALASSPDPVRHCVITY